MTLADFFNVRNAIPTRSTSLNIRKRLAVWHTRRVLADLDAAALQDIGITAEEAEREARLGVWDVPETWTRL